MNKIVVAVLLLAFALFGVNAQAAVSLEADNPNAITAQPQALPNFMQNLNATPMTDAEMAEVRGELLPLWVAQSMFYTGMTIGAISYRLAPYAYQFSAWCTINCETTYSDLSNIVTFMQIFGWDVGRWYAITIDGLPDPGPYGP